MKKSFTRLAALIIFGSAFVGSTAQANCAYEEGLWTASGHFAFAPSVFNEDLQFTSALANTAGGPVTITSGDTDTTQANLVKRSKKFKFKDHYEHPKRAGLDIGYFFRKGTELFIGADYYFMCGKNYALFDQTLASTRFAIEGKVKARNRLGIYAGVRHFFDVCSWYYPYLGFKVGAVWHMNRDKDKHEDLNYRVLNGVTIDGKTQYLVNGARGILGLYGGLHAGIDIPLVCVDPCLKYTSFFLGVEAVGHGAIEYDLPIKRINTTNGGFQLTHEVTQAPRTFMSFPLTAGIKVRF